MIDRDKLKKDLWAFKYSDGPQAEEEQDETHQAKVRFVSKFTRGFNEYQIVALSQMFAKYDPEIVPVTDEEVSTIMSEARGNRTVDDSKVKGPIWVMRGAYIYMAKPSADIPGQFVCGYIDPRDSDNNLDITYSANDWVDNFAREHQTEEHLNQAIDRCSEDMCEKLKTFFNI